MIQNPSVAGSGGNAENVSVAFNYLYRYRPEAYCYYSTIIENGSVVEKRLDVSGQTISAAKGSTIIAFTDPTYNVLLNASGVRTIATFYNVPGEDMDISEFPVVSAQTVTVRVYEATG